MRLVTATVWTSRRKWLGNLIPAVFWLPPALYALFQIIVKNQLGGPALWSLLASTVLGWLAVNQFGFFENRRMEGQLKRILDAQEQKLTAEHYFVGFATPKYSSMLDAHEDVGFLCLYPDRLQFVSESRRIELSKSEISDVRFRPNVHSIIFLGRWVSVEGVSGGKQVRLLVEPRVKTTLLGNRLYGAKLRSQLKKWLGSVK
jgi:hypothetical protein